MKFKYQAHLLNQLKIKQGIQSAAIAEALGVSEAYVSNMMKGKAGIPPERVARLFGFLDLEVIERAALKDFRASWHGQIKKGFTLRPLNGKAPRHEKTKGTKKQKSKT